jgi:HEAT repeat protein
VSNLLIELILFIIFLFLFAVGFFIIYKQVALIKKGEFNIRDRLQCLIYGLIFGAGVMVVIAMAFIFAVKTPEFWQNNNLTPPNINPLALLIPFAFCIGYISFYPLIDFLFIALSSESDEGLTPFHKFISNKIINFSTSKIISVLMAVLLYLLFIIPPLLLTFTGLPFLMIWISWLLVYPLMILSFYGSKGYIAGISNEYYHIPELKRSIFLNFEDSKRGMKQFILNPKPYMMLGLMLFVFIWAGISLFQTIIFFFSRSLAISTMSSSFVFVTLLFGIIGYFTRFWGRKIKYRGIDIYFAAYLMAAIGINVLVNFLIVNIDKLTETFNYLIISTELITNSYMFAWAAIIEEIFMLTFTTYYFLSKNNSFTKNLKYSKIIEYGQTFDAVPLFNFIKSSDPLLRDHAEKTLLMMYERIPLKSEILLDNWVYKDSLMDGISDSNPNSRRISIQILKKLEKDTSEVIIPWILEGLESPNYDKSIPIAESILHAEDSLLKKLPKKVIRNLISDSEWRMKLIGLKLLTKSIKIGRDSVQNLNLMKLLSDPNSFVQIEVLNLLSESQLTVKPEILLNKIHHPNQNIRAAAIRNLSNLNLDNIDSNIVMTLVPLMQDANSKVRASIYEIISKIGNFKKFSIPILPLYEGLIDSDEEVRKASVFALGKYYVEKPKSIDLDQIISQIDTENIDSLNSIISLLGIIWQSNPEKILTTLLIFIKFNNSELKERISNILVKNYEKTPNLILNKIIEIKDESKFITKGIISQTIIKISRQYPNEVIPKLIDQLNSEDLYTKINIISALDGLIDDFIDSIALNSILGIIKGKNENVLKKEAAQLILKVSKTKPFALKSELAELLELLPEQELSVRIVLTKSVLEISKNLPDIISIPLVIDYLSDTDSFIRETSVKILGYIGKTLPIPTINALINQALIDEEWIVRDATVASLGKLISFVEDKEIIIENLVNLMDDDKSWVRRSSMKILSSIKEISESKIPFIKVSENLLNEDPKVREGAANLLNIYTFEDIDKVFQNIISLLGDEVEDVRATVVDVMVKIIQKMGITKLLSKLLKNLSDEFTIETQQSIAIILGRTVRYEDEKIKKRVISLLKIRCEMSQDKIICEILNKLREG